MRRQALQSALFLPLKKDEILKVSDWWTYLFLCKLFPGKDRNSPLICISPLKLPESDSLKLNSSPY